MPSKIMALIRNASKSELIDIGIIARILLCASETLTPSVNADQGQSMPSKILALINQFWLRGISDQSHDFDQHWSPLMGIGHLSREFCNWSISKSAKNTFIYSEDIVWKMITK